jgi:hypothetical protein
MNESRRPLRWFGAALIAALTCVGVAAAVAPDRSPPEVTAKPGSTGMCHGRSDANLVLTASNVGLEVTSPGYEIEIETDAEGHPTGVLVSGRGADQLRVEEWCRLWAPRSSGEQSGERDASETETTMVHAVGFGELGDGTPVFVRTDLKSTEDGLNYRIRYRELQDRPETGRGDAAEVTPLAGEGDQGVDEDWTQIPEEEWAALTQFVMQST